MGNFKKKFAKWKLDTDEHGPRAMTRYVIMLFVEGLHGIAPDRYIFKGGNLLWHYIKTPRSTVDVDFATDSKLETAQVLSDFANVKVEGCTFMIKAHHLVQAEDKSGLAIQMEFLTEEGSVNPFGVDVVFAIKTHSKKIKLSNTQVTAASLENIIVDKVSACHRFAGGNTRMKDFDDLYRIAHSSSFIDFKVVFRLAQERGVLLALESKWANPALKSSWIEYTKKKIHKDAHNLPKDLTHIIESINVFLLNVTNIAK